MSLWSAVLSLVSGEAPAPAARPATTAAAPSTPRRTAPLEPPRQQETAKPMDPSDVRRFLDARLSEGLHRIEGSLGNEAWMPSLRELLEALTGESGGHLRQMPSAAQRALSACEDEDVSTAALVSLFESDPTLTEALLTRANSAYYNPSGRPCFSLAEAIVRQGRRSAHSVILQQVLSGLVCRPGGAWTLMANQTWTHMVRTGPIARALAPAFGADPDQAMAIGLLHDVGKLVVFDRVSSLRAATRNEFNLPPRQVSRLLRAVHEPLGGLCALHWNLGPETALVIAQHHRDPIPADPQPLTEVIWLAERADLAVARSAPLKLDELWRAGALNGRIDEAAAALDLPPVAVSRSV